MDDLKNIIWRQKNRAPGANGITARILRASWPAIDLLLLRLINKCIEIATFPNCWKSAIIVIILKGKDKDTLVPKSYRPVSLLPILGKVLEEVIYILLEFEVGALLSPSQHGYKPGKSSYTALHEVQEWVNDSRGKHVLGTFLDISGDLIM